MSPVEQIKERLNIVELIQEYIPLQKSGSQFKARCPFHQEKTPSFSVSEQKQFFHCFGCGKSGDVFAFVQAMENVEFVEALRLLAQKANVELKGYSREDRTEKTRIIDCLHEAAIYYASMLWGPKGIEALAYVRSRGLTDETIHAFQIGYSDESWDGVITALKAKQFTEKEIESSGITARSSKTGQYFDRFRGRVMYPIHNSYGNVIGFGGRILKEEESQAKYINSPQTALYNKSAVLYGIHLAKAAIKKMNAVMLVEGYMDVIGCHQAKFRNVVAASGTALTVDHIRLIKRFTHNVILAFDGDRAGFAAAWKGMQLAIQNGMNIKVIALPDGKDPDELALHDPEGLRALAVAARPFMEYAFQTVLSPLDLTQVAHKKKAAGDLVPLLALFPDPVERTHYIQSLAEQIHVPVHVIQEQVDAILHPKVLPRARVQNSVATTQQGVVPAKPRPRTRNAQLQERLVAIVSTDPELLRKELPDVDTIIQEPWLALYKILKNQYSNAGTLSLEGIDYSNPQLRSLLEATVMLGEDLYVQMTPQEREEEYQIITLALTREALKLRIQVVQQQIAVAERTGDEASVNACISELRQLTDHLKRLR